MKEQNTSPEKELNKIKTSYPLNTESKTLFIRMLNDFMRTSAEIGNIKIEIENI